MGLACRFLPLHHPSQNLLRVHGLQLDRVLPAAVVEDDDLAAGPQPQHARDLVGDGSAQRHLVASYGAGRHKEPVHVRYWRSGIGCW